MTFTKHIVYPTKTVSAIESSKITPITGTIATGDTVVVDSSDYSTFFATRYFVAVQSVSGKTNTFDYSIADDGAGGLKQVVFGQIFGGLALETNSFVDSGIVVDIYGSLNKQEWVKLDGATYTITADGDYLFTLSELKSLGYVKPVVSVNSGSAVFYIIGRTV
jgi:uncharacterized protein YraI